MNEYEIENFKQQSKYSQVIFEDFSMVLIDVLILSKVLKVDKALGKSFSENILL